MHHTEDYFPNAGCFVPERWIPGKIMSKEQVEHAYDALHPFSIGPRSCTGRNMAMVQIKLVLARVLWLYDFKRAGGDLGLVGCGDNAEEYQLRSHITATCDGPVLVFKARSE